MAKATVLWTVAFDGAGRFAVLPVEGDRIHGAACWAETRAAFFARKRALRARGQFGLTRAQACRLRDALKASRRKRLAALSPWELAEARLAEVRFSAVPAEKRAPRGGAYAR